MRAPVAGQSTVSYGCAGEDAARVDCCRVTDQAVEVFVADLSGNVGQTRFDGAACGMGGAGSKHKV